MTDAENTKPELPKNVRVRFCPSPTGTPHVGMIRTALFNWAEARATGGTLIFRIEDTDAVRDSEESYNQILESLRWLGIDWDEGIDVGGPHGPYRQSERTAIYKDVAAKLLEAGYAYESFSTPEEIKERNLAAGRPAEFGYDGYDRNLTDEQKAAFRAEGRKPALRIKMPDEDIAFDDLIRGTIEFKAGSVPDYVIVRPNGDPLYTLTNPVDDAMMEVNVVLRGEDLLSSTPRQIVLYRYLMELGIAKEMPLFGHMPYVMGQGIDELGRQQLINKLIEINDFADFSDIVPVSALKHDNLAEVKNVLIEHTPEGPQMYPDDQISEERPEDTIAELVRGAFLETLDDERPHSLAVVVDSIDYPEDNETGQGYDGKAQVNVSIYVERDSQKPIIIGKGASNLTYVKKKLRTPVNRIVGQKAKLDLHVKVAKGWQSDPKQLERLGF